MRTRVLIIPIFTTLVTIILLTSFDVIKVKEPAEFMLWCLVMYPFGVLGAWFGDLKDKKRE